MMLVKQHFLHSQMLLCSFCFCWFHAFSAMLRYWGNAVEEVFTENTSFSRFLIEINKRASWPNDIKWQLICFIGYRPYWLQNKREFAIKSEWISERMFEFFITLHFWSYEKSSIKSPQYPQLLLFLKVLVWIQFACHRTDLLKSITEV